MNFDALKDLGELGLGAAAGMGLYMGALRARLNVLRDELRLTRRSVKRLRRHFVSFRKTLNNLPCQKVECRNDQPPSVPDRVLGGDR